MHKTPNPPSHVILGPSEPTCSLVLDSPHSGRWLPDDAGSRLPTEALREGEDCFIDELYAPAVARGVPLLAATFARTYLDPNRDAADIDPELLEEPWPGPLRSSGKAAVGKSLIWRTLDDGRPIYDRRLSVAEVRSRIERFHAPYHAALRELLDRAHARFGVVHHINCHSMNAVGGAMSEQAGVPRADIVLGDRDGTTCAPAFTAFVRETFEGLGYTVKVNDPFKGVELVRAYADPARGRHSLQVEINKRLYLEDGLTPNKSAGFATLQAHLAQLVEAVQQRFAAPARPLPAP